MQIYHLSVSTLPTASGRDHQDIKQMEGRYQGKWNVNMLADYYWCLKRDSYNAFHKRRSDKRSFIQTQ